MPSFLTGYAIAPAPLIVDVATAECGAVILFLGTVRSGPGDGDIEGIEYSAYPEMADAEFQRIIDEARGRWPEARVALRHRTGYIRVGEASVAIAVAAPHRAEAYDCSRYVIDETKKRVPIWKKERLASGEARWVGAVQPSSRPAVEPHHA